MAAPRSYTGRCEGIREYNRAMIIDEAFITVQGGKGGDGIAAYFPNKSGPAGGNGGAGANVYARANRQLTTLMMYARKHLFAAEPGVRGGSFQMTGADAPDLYLDFPVGTELIDNVTNGRIELLKDGQVSLLCVGGTGGYGNEHYKTATNRTPRRFDKGTPGQKRQFKVIMRLIADVGFIGLPNAGKSSLLNELTSASAKVAPYPFTTLEPNLGSLGGFGRNIILADIPGLIEGASNGRGLGTKFLKHVEKVSVLLHCIPSDMAASEIVKTYKAVRTELGAFNRELLKKREIVLLTKSDLVRPQDRPRKVEALRKVNPDVYSVSVYDLDALNSLKKMIGELNTENQA